MDASSSSARAPAQQQNTAKKKRRKNNPEVRVLTQKIELGGGVPQHVRVLNHVGEHREDLLRFVETLPGAPKKNEIVTKKTRKEVPRCLRRRALSHNSYRLPTRLKSSGPRIRELRPIRVNKRNNKYFSKLAFLTQEEGLENTNNEINIANYNSQNYRLLHTHLWHAKRFLMRKMWGNVVVPIKPRDKGIRAITKAVTQRAIAHDASYNLIIELVGKNCFDFESHHKIVDNLFCSIVPTKNDVFLVFHAAALEKFPNLFDMIKKKFSCEVKHRSDLAYFMVKGPKSTTALAQTLKSYNNLESRDLTEFYKIAEKSKDRFVRVGDGKIFHLPCDHGSSSTLVRRERKESPRLPMRIRKAVSGWGVFISSHIARDFWKKLQYAGCVAVGIQNLHSIRTMANAPDPLFDELDNCCTKIHSEIVKQELLAHHLARPAAHRPNFGVLGIESPFSVNFGRMEGCVRVAVESLISSPKPFAVLSYLTINDFKRVLDSLSRKQWEKSCPFLEENQSNFGKGDVYCLEENLHKDKKCRGKTKKAAKDVDKLAKIFPSVDIPKLLDNNKPLAMDVEDEFVTKNLRETIGQVSSGGHCFARGHGFGIGFINCAKLNSCLEEQQKIWQERSLHLRPVPIDCKNIPAEFPVMLWCRNTTTLRYVPVFVYKQI